MTPVALAAQKTRLRIQGVGQFLGHSMDAVLVIAWSALVPMEKQWRTKMTLDVLYMIVDMDQYGFFSQYLHIVCVSRVWHKKSLKLRKGLERNCACSSCKAPQEHHAAGNSYETLPGKGHKKQLCMRV